MATKSLATIFFQQKYFVGLVAADPRYEATVTNFSVLNVFFLCIEIMISLMDDRVVVVVGIVVVGGSWK